MDKIKGTLSIRAGWIILSIYTRFGNCLPGHYPSQNPLYEFEFINKTVLWQTLFLLDYLTKDASFLVVLSWQQKTFVHHSPNQSQISFRPSFLSKTINGFSTALQGTLILFCAFPSLIRYVLVIPRLYLL